MILLHQNFIKTLVGTLTSTCTLCMCVHSPSQEDLMHMSQYFKISTEISELIVYKQRKRINDHYMQHKIGLGVISTKNFRLQLCIVPKMVDML